jgi:hypothetical protein
MPINIVSKSKLPRAIAKEKNGITLYWVEEYGIAGLHQRGLESLLKCSISTIQNALKGCTGIKLLEAEILTQQGLRTVQIITESDIPKVLRYIARSKAKIETRDRADDVRDQLAAAGFKLMTMLEIVPEELAVQSFDRIKDPKKIAQTKARIDGIAARKLETNAFQATGLVKENYQYGILTNATYEGLLGADAKSLKVEMGLKPKQSLRDNLPDKILVAIQLSELVASEKAANATSFDHLKSITYQQAHKIRMAIA